jgi:hypothetical protein
MNGFDTNSKVNNLIINSLMQMQNSQLHLTTIYNL